MSTAAGAGVSGAPLFHRCERSLTGLGCPLDGNFIQPLWRETSNSSRRPNGAEHHSVGDAHISPLRPGVDPVATLQVDGYGLAFRERERLASGAILEDICSGDRGHRTRIWCAAKVGRVVYRRECCAVDPYAKPQAHDDACAERDESRVHVI